MKVRPYLEPDYFAQGHDGSLPILSTIGRGPKGDSVVARKDGSKLIIEDGEGNVLATFDLGTPSISVSQPAEIESGKESEMKVRITDSEGRESENVIFLPCGEQGTRLYFVGNAFEKADNNIYFVPASMIWTELQDDIVYPDYYMAKPRVGDMMLLPIDEETEPATSNVAFATVMEILDTTDIDGDDTDDFDEEDLPIYVCVAHGYMGMHFVSEYINDAWLNDVLLAFGTSSEDCKIHPFSTRTPPILVAAPNSGITDWNIIGDLEAFPRMYLGEDKWMFLTNFRIGASSVGVDLPYDETIAMVGGHPQYKVSVIGYEAHLVSSEYQQVFRNPEPLIATWTESDNERNALLKIPQQVLSGTPNMIDVSGYVIIQISDNQM